MSPDAGPPTGSTWTLLDRGSFVVGSCATCGYTGPARRARGSAESDMRAHEVLCGATHAQPAGTDARVGEGRREKVVASGRERLSAQGRS